MTVDRDQPALDHGGILNPFARENARSACGEGWFGGARTPWYCETLCFQADGDLIKIGGASLVPDDVEQFVETHCTRVDPGGSCLLCSVSADGVTVAKLLIEVEVGRQSCVDDEWQRWLRRELAVPFGLWGLSILIVSEGTIQRTGSGKKRRKAIADRCLRGEVATLMPSGLKPGSIPSVEDDAMPA